MRALLLLIVLVIAGGALLCVLKPKPSDYAAGTPVLQPDVFFNGPLKSWGVMRNFYTGKELMQFSMQAQASWQGDKGQMHETLTFADGTHKERFWTFTKTDEHHFIGTAPDVDGDAKGECYGNALHWVYNIRVNTGSKEVTVHFDDWLYQVDDSHMFSFIRISKWGIPLAKLTMFFSKG